MGKEVQITRFCSYFMALANSILAHRFLDILHSAGILAHDLSRLMHGGIATASLQAQRAG